MLRICRRLLSFPLFIKFHRFYSRKSVTNFHMTIICNYSADIYLFKVNNRNTRTMCEISAKLTVKTPSFWCLYCWLWTNFTYCSGVSIVEFVQLNNVGWDTSCYKGYQNFFWVDLMPEDCFNNMKLLVAMIWIWLVYSSIIIYICKNIKLKTKKLMC